MSTPLEWGALALEPGASEVELSFGTLTLSARRDASELWLRADHGDPDSAEWVRWYAPPETEFELRPVLPDRPIVVAPELPYRLPPRGRSQVFVSVPMFVRVVARLGSEVQTLEDHPSEVLSDTWWGGFTEGELAYWVETRARRAIPESDLERHLAICPFRLINESAQSLPVEHFAVRVDYLSLFATDSAVWTDEVQVVYGGPEEGSEIDHTGRAPEVAGPVTRIAEPRTPAPSGLRARTFSRIRALALGER